MLEPGRFDTPCLVVDLDVVSSNIRRMQANMTARGTALRPHAKTHKSVEVARRQVAAGARGLTVGTLGEAEIFAAAGLTDLFLAYPIWATESKASRLRALAERCSLLVGIDSEAGVKQLAAAIDGRSLAGVVIEVDSGGRRTGVTPNLAGAVAVAADRAGHQVVGLFTHGGHAYAGPDDVVRAAGDEVSALVEAAAALLSDGFEVALLSAGSTPTVHGSGRSVITEERPGTYVFGDRQQLALGACRPVDIGLAVAATVVSVSDDHVVIDSGAKSLSNDAKPWLSGFGTLAGYPDARITALYDYHGIVVSRPGTPRPTIGQVVLLTPNHVCPVVNLFDRMHVLANGHKVDEWIVDARARSA